MHRIVTLFLIVVICPALLSSSSSANCTIGYWKNHTSLWTGTDLELGEVFYTHEELIQILDESTEGNGLVSMSHQLIAAKLNVLSGAEPIQAIWDADALIGSLVVPPIGSGFLDPSVTHDLNEALTEFNEFGSEDCIPISVEEVRWSDVKSSYR